MSQAACPAGARPFSLLADRRPQAAALAERRTRRGLGYPEHRAFPVRPAVDLDHRPTTQFVPDVLNYSWRDYGVRVGIWRMMEVMEKYGIKGTVALNSDVCEQYPRIIEGGKQLGWEWMGHGNNNSS